MDVPTQMSSAALRNAHRTAVVAGGRRIVFLEAWTRGVRMANALRTLGIAPQDRVGVLEDNCLEASDFFLGAAIVAKTDGQIKGFWNDPGGAAVTEDALAELCATKLGRYMRPGRIVLQTGALPKTPVGKIKRKELREPFWQGHARRVGGN